VNLKVFADFDGTVSAVDVGNLLYRTLGDAEACEAIVRSWKEEEISSRECLLRESATIPPLHDGEFDSFIDAQSLDPGFEALLAFCRGHGIELTVVSDGLDYYIARIFRNAGVTDVRFFSNHLEFTDDRRFRITFPYPDEECTHCANCKRNHLLAGSGEEDVIVYIGDGKSDWCAARHADIIFAKRDLARYCTRERIPYHQFTTLHDVVEQLERIVARKRLRRRRQAELSRRAVFRQG
jgi:2,3-diketo-5-methylthio-1-phosphopentane phosphatase